MKLNDTFVRKLKPEQQSRKYADGQGLFLFVNSNGTKSWRFRYRDINGKEKEMTFGTYPELSLAEAREKRLEQRRLVINGIDPIAEKKGTVEKQRAIHRNTFQVVAEEWHELNRQKWTARYATSVTFRLKKYGYPNFGDRPVSEITTLEILSVLRAIEKNGSYVLAHRILQYFASIFRFAVITQRVKYNPCNDLKSVLVTGKVKHYPTIKITELPEFINQLDNHLTTETNKLAIKLLMLTFVRQGELRRAKWEYFDIEKRIWCIPAEIMKMKRDHLVPLSKQAIAILNQLKDISGSGEYLFPTKNKMKYPYMNENVINNILHDMRYKDRLVAHGFRSLASTTLNELGFASDVIEKQLAHEERNKVRAAYNRAEYLPQRIELMQAWADHIDRVCLKAKQKNFEKISA